MAVVSTEAVKSRIVEMLVDFGAEEEDLVPEARLEDLEIDSLDLFELGQVLKKEFGIWVPPEEFEGVETLGQALDLLMGEAK
jgi:acyl carrier protein